MPDKILPHQTESWRDLDIKESFSLLSNLIEASDYKFDKVNWFSDLQKGTEGVACYITDKQGNMKGKATFATTSNTENTLPSYFAVENIKGEIVKVYRGPHAAEESNLREGLLSIDINL